MITNAAGLKLEGILSFPVTPFAEAGGIDVDAFEAHLRVQLATDAGAIFVAGAAGEFTALTLAEFATVVRTAVDVCGGRLPVIAGVGGGTAVAREFRDVAIENGVDGLLLLPPYLLASTPAGLVEHVRQVARGSSIPVIVYQRANAVLNVAAALELLDVPEVLGLKDGVGDVSAMLRIVTAVRTSGHPRAQEFQFFNGLPTAELGVQAYSAIGVRAYSSAVLSMAPQVAGAFYAAFDRGDEPGMQRLLAEFYLPLAALRDEVPGYAVALVKAGARISGIPVGGVRAPLVDPTPEHFRRLEGLIAAGTVAADAVNAGQVAVAG